MDAVLLFVACALLTVMVGFTVIYGTYRAYVWLAVQS
jgi:hypothetical protein